MAVKPCGELPSGGFFQIKNKLGQARTGGDKYRARENIDARFRFCCHAWNDKVLKRKRARSGFTRINDIQHFSFVCFREGERNKKGGRVA